MPWRTFIKMDQDTMNRLTLACRQAERNGQTIFFFDGMNLRVKRIKPIIEDGEKLLNDLNDLRQEIINAQLTRD